MKFGSHLGRENSPIVRTHFRANLLSADEKIIFPNTNIFPSRKMYHSLDNTKEVKVEAHFTALFLPAGK